MNKLKTLLTKMIQSAWADFNPKLVTPPKVEPGLEDLDPLLRSSEALLYSILSLEFWIAPNGQLREWLRHNSRAAVWLLIPAILILPLLVFVLWQVVKVLALLIAVMGKLAILPLGFLLAATVIYVGVRLVKAFLGMN